MSFWNPKEKRFLFFHVTFGGEPRGYRNCDYYLKVDTVEKRVWKVCHRSFKAINHNGKTSNHQGGIYELTWSTFSTNQAHYLSRKSRHFIRQCELADGKQRTRVKYTSEAQFMGAFYEAVELITGTKEFSRFSK